MSKLLALAVFSFAATAMRKWGEHELCGVQGVRMCNSSSGCRDPYTEVRWSRTWECWFGERICMYEDCVKPGECAIYMYEHHNGEGFAVIVKGERVQDLSSIMRGKLSSIQVLGSNCNVWVYDRYGSTGRALHLNRPGLYNFNGRTNDAIKSFRVRKKSNRGRRRVEESNGDAAERLSAIIAETSEDFDNEPEEEVLETEWGSAVMMREEEEDVDLESLNADEEEFNFGEDEESVKEDEEEAEEMFEMVEACMEMEEACEEDPDTEGCAECMELKHEFESHHFNDASYDEDDEVQYDEDEDDFDEEDDDSAF